MRKAFIILTALLVTVAASAQTALNFIQEELNPSAAGLAGVAYASPTQGMAYSVFGNPAVQALVQQKFDVAAGYRNIPASEGKSINNITAAAGVEFGKFGISAGYHGEFFPAVAGASEGGGNMSDIVSSASLFGLGLSLGIGENLGFGANVRFGMHVLDKSTTLSAVNFDVMAIYSIAGINLTAGVVALGPKVKSVSNTEYDLPASARLGVDYALPLGSLNLEAMAGFDYYFSGNVGAGVAAQLGFKDMAFARVGFRYGSAKEPFNVAPVPTHLSLGLGGKFFGVRLDVAYQLIFAGRGGILSAGLAYSF
ncbi:MAG: hypothetical protein IJU21_07240 [Bacteroidales bacterium]|nr:hypothetical protein [Bacteroidales bacterium]